jgi:hypothetical protein
LDTITQPILGKFPIKAKISMTISNSIGHSDVEGYQSNSTRTQ